MKYKKDKTTKIVIRVNPDLKNTLKQKGDMSKYVLALIEKDLNLNIAKQL